MIYMSCITLKIILTNLKQRMKKMKKNILLIDYMHLIKKIKNTKDKMAKKDLKQIKKEYVELLEKTHGELELAGDLKH